MTHSLRLTTLPDRLAVCRMEQHAAVPGWAVVGSFCSITRTTDELSLVCLEAMVPPGVQMESGWRALKVEGPLDFTLTGILAGLSGALAKARISLFAISTYDTDYILVKETDLDRAVEALREAGCQCDS